MTEEVHSVTDPRWGQKDREQKAEAIFATVERHCRRNFSDGLWLDIGCGSGGVAAALASHVRQIVGIDPEPWERWQRIGDEHPNLAFHVGSYHDITKLLGPESVDVVVCNQVYEHVDDPVALLEAINRVMKPTGVCYFAGPNLLWPIEPHVFWPFVHWLPRSFAQHWMRRLGSSRADDLDAWSWSYWALARLFRQRGFHYASAVHARLQAGAEGAGAGKLLRLAARMPRVLARGLTPITPSFVFVLEKSPKRNA